jgi:hypothetical protein
MLPLVVLVGAATAAADMPANGSGRPGEIDVSPAGDVVSVEYNPTLLARIAPADRGLGPPTTLSTQGGYAPTVAVGPQGQALAAWAVGGSSRRYMVAYRAPGGAFGVPTVLTGRGPDFGEQVVIRFDAVGTATIAWAPVRGGLSIRTRSALGVWSLTKHISGRHASRPVLVTGPDGTASLAWEQQGRREREHEVAVAARRPDGSVGPARVLARGTEQPSISRPVPTVRARSAARGSHRVGSLIPAEPVIAGNDRGDAVVAWVDVSQRGARTSFSVYGSFRTRFGRFGAAKRLSRRGMNAYLPSVALAPDGTVTIAWTTSGPPGVDARIRSADGRLQPVRTLSGRSLPDAPATALTLGTGAVAWLDGKSADAVGRRPAHLRLAAVSAGRTFGSARTLYSPTNETLEPNVFSVTGGLVVIDPNQQIRRFP